MHNPTYFSDKYDYHGSWNSDPLVYIPNRFKHIVHTDNDDDNRKSGSFSLMGAIANSVVLTLTVVETGADPGIWERGRNFPLLSLLLPSPTLKTRPR